MALTQMQLIQSLGEAMSWFERELSWGVPPTELRHLCGRIGELYAALISNGQMALEVNQRGYDVVSGSGERISVKTTARMDLNGSVTFNQNTLNEVDRIMVLRMNTVEMQIEILLDESKENILPRLTGENKLSLARLVNPVIPVRVAAAREAQFRDYLLRELETGTIEVFLRNDPVQPVKPVLRELAGQLDIGLLNGQGNEYNTRQLGTLIINSIKAVAKK